MKVLTARLVFAVFYGVVETCASSVSAASLPLVAIAKVPLPGGATRLDYQDIDPAQKHLIIAHMNDGTVIVADLSDGSVVKVIADIPTARGIAVADDVGLFFVTSSPSQLVAINNVTLKEVRRVATGNGPDGVAWDPTHKIVGVSDQRDGAISLIANAGAGKHTQIPLGSETGNVAFDAPRGLFWITVVKPGAPDQLVGVNPTTAQVMTAIALPRCEGAHGLRLHPDGQSAFVACEGNNKLARVELAGAHHLSLGATGKDPDVLAIDPGLGWLYVAAESGDLSVFDINRPGVALVGHFQVAKHAHSIAVDPATHRVFFPLMDGGAGTPVLSILKPAGT